MQPRDDEHEKGNGKAMTAVRLLRSMQADLAEFLWRGRSRKRAVLAGVVWLGVTGLVALGLASTAFAAIFYWIARTAPTGEQLILGTAGEVVRLLRPLFWTLLGNATMCVVMLRLTVSMVRFAVASASDQLRTARG